MPGTVGGGEQIIDPPMLGSLGAPGTRTVLLVVITSTFVSYAAGTPGGVFAPMLALGTIVGMLVGVFAHPLCPTSWSTRSAWRSRAWQVFTHVRAPLTGIILVSELTGGFDMALATTLTCATASLTAAWFGGEPLYEQLLSRAQRLGSNGTSRQR